MVTRCSGRPTGVNTMSVSAFSPVSLRSQPLHAHAPDLDPRFSFALTSGTGASALGASTVSYGYALHNGVLSKDVIHDGLSDMGRTGDGTTVAYLSLSVSGQGLEDITILSVYPHLQTVNLSQNNLTDITALGSLPHLTYLDLSYNKLSTVLDFHPPLNLKEVNYSHNEIEELCDLSCHRSLTKLQLDSNQIIEVEGVCGLRCLTHLSLADNRIERIANLDHLPLKHLNLSGNSIQRIENLETLTQLQVLDLSGNQVSSLLGLQCLLSLRELDVEENQVVKIKEVEHLKDLRLLQSFNLTGNPVQAVRNYRSTVLFYLKPLVRLDYQKVHVEEKVAACNRFAPPAEVVAASDHRVNTSSSMHKPARLKFSTLTRVDEPYPMLVLCGPPGAGKADFVKLLVEEFPSFFGLGLSHTTRPQRHKEGHGRDYYFINEGTFDRACKSGEFVQTARLAGARYGLTMAAIELVAQQGLACVTHMSIEGVLTLKNTHFEPRYILTLPMTSQIHRQRLKAKDCYSDKDIEKAVADTHHYQRLHQERPGFFDTAINTDSLREGYAQLRALVMAYGDISPESPLSLTSLSQHTQQTSATTSEMTTPLPTSRTHTPSILLESSEVIHTGQMAYGMHTGAPHGMQNAPRAWSRPSSSTGHTVSDSIMHIEPKKSRSHTPILAPDLGSRRQRQIQAALMGMENTYEESSASTSRPGTSLSKSFASTGTKLEPSGGIAEEEEELSEGSSEESEHSDTASTLSKLSSERGFSPQHPGTPQSMD